MVRENIRHILIIKKEKKNTVYERTQSILVIAFCEI